MPELTPTGAVDVVRRQVRRVRWRKNFYELQRTLYWSVAAAALVATVLLPLALLAPERIFAGAAWSALAVVGVIVWRLGRSVRRGWLARRAAVPWIEDRGALAGRLRTLLEIASRPPAATAFFRPLLIAEVARDLDRWTPQRLVPRRLPRAALATAAVATAVLVVVVRLAALAIPTAPPIIAGRGAVGVEPADPSEAEAAGAPSAERVIVAPDDGAAREANVADRAESPLATLPSALQESVRRQVWGKAWERVRDQLARAGGGGGGGDRLAGDRGHAEEMATDDGEEWELARAPSGNLARRHRARAGEQSAAQGDEADAPTAEPRHDSAASTEHDSDAGGGGAGTGVAPDLFGPASDDGLGTPQGSFELSIAARMRADHLGERRAEGSAPPADRDARPALAADQRRESAAHRMTVPPAYETVVREVFAHRRGGAAE